MTMRSRPDRHPADPGSPFAAITSPIAWNASAASSPSGLAVIRGVVDKDRVDLVAAVKLGQVDDLRAFDLPRFELFVVDTYLPRLYS
jgi:hypothetical protein